MGLDVGFAFWNFEFLANTQLAWVADSISLHEVAVGDLESAGYGVEVVAAVEDVFGHCGCWRAWLNGWLGRRGGSRDGCYGFGCGGS